MKIDTSFWGYLKAIGYLIVCGYSWVNSKGIEARVLAILLAFMCLDVLLGWIKASVVKKLENPTSQKAKKGLLGKLIMFVIPVVCGLIWSIFDKEGALRIVNTMIVALAVAEGYSVIANASIIYTGESLSEFDAVSFVFKKVGLLIKNLLTQLLK